MSPRLAQAVALAAASFAVLSPTAAHAASWSAPVTVAPAAAGDNPSASPAIAVDGDGDLTAAWAGDGAAGVGIYSATRGAAPTAPWSAATKLAAAVDPRGVQVAVNAGGQAVAGWSDEGLGGSRDLWSATRTSAGAWTEASSVTTGSAEPTFHQLGIEPSGGIFGLLKQDESMRSLAAPAGGDLVGGDPFTPAATMDQSGFELAVDGSGTATVVYVDATDLVVLSATRPAGGVWSTPTPIEVGTTSAQQPRIAVTPNGRAVAVWVRASAADAEGAETARVLRTATRGVDGVWSAASTLHTAADNSAVTSIDAGIDALGRRTATWVTIESAKVDGADALISRIHSSTALSASPWSTPAAIAPAANGFPFYSGVRLAVGITGPTVVLANKGAAPAGDIQGAVRTKTGAWEPWASIAPGITVADADLAPAAAVVDAAGLGTVLWADGRTVGSRSIELDPRPAVDPGTKTPDPVTPDPTPANPSTGGTPTDTSSDDLPEDPAPTPVAKSAKLVVSLYVLPSGKKCPAIAAATVDGVRTNLKVKKTKLRKKLACKATGTVVLKPTVEVGAKVKVLITAKGVKKKTVQLVAIA